MGVSISTVAYFRFGEVVLLVFSTVTGLVRPKVLARDLAKNVKDSIKRGTERKGHETYSLIVR